MFKAEYAVAYGTGGYKHMPHRIFTGKGTAICRSPKQAVRLAQRRADAASGGSEWIPVYAGGTLTNLQTGETVRLETY